MRKLLITRGLQGSGKSTAIRELGLENHMVSFDKTREFLNGPYLMRSGELEIPQHRNKEVWKMTMDILSERMRVMETIAFDATFPKIKDLQTVLELAKTNRYDVKILDFYSMPIEQVKLQNLQRKPYKQVPESAIDRTMAEYQELIDPRKINWSVNGSHINTVRDSMQIKTRDLNAYNEVVIIGDLQGCFQPIVNSNSPLVNGLEQDKFYVFCCDFFDRGLENVEVAKWLNQHVVGKPNVAFARGNHELHIERMVNGLEPISSQFREHTLYEFEAARLEPEFFRPLVDKLEEVVPFTWRGSDVIVTHGGLSSWPKDLHLVPGDQFESGFGTYDMDIDETFNVWSKKQDVESENSKKIFLQAHGHRNSAMKPLLAHERSFNLEGSVEFGGHLRMIRMTENGIIPIEIRNTLFRSRAEIVQEKIDKGYRMQGPSLPNPSWHKRGEIGQTSISQEGLKELKQHKLINERVSAVLTHVSAFNFSHQAFRKGIWDPQNKNARGLFISYDGDIVGRGFPKFFNVGERPETTIEYLKENLKFPVNGYLKENGFLGITGYDKRTDTLVTASKSMLDSEFAGWFREILEEQLGPSGMERLYRVNRDFDASCVFEVIDIKRDPHIISYEKNQVILLDVIRRSEKFEALPYKDLQLIGNYLECPIKENSFSLDNPTALERFLKKTEDRDFTWKGKHIEGFVMEDADGTMVKSKSAYYVFWKNMRGMVDRLVKHQLDGRDFNSERYENDPLAKSFVKFCEKQPTKALQESGIILLRETFDKNPQHILPGKNIEHNHEKNDEQKMLDGFRRGAENVGKQLLEGKAKKETIERIINIAREDDKKIQILEEIPGFRERLNFMSTSR